MSYCRFGEGDIYMYQNVEGLYVCCACRLNNKDVYGLRDNKYYETTRGALKHLRKHKKAGHIVPLRAREMLRQELRRMKK